MPRKPKPDPEPLYEDVLAQKEAEREFIERLNIGELFRRDEERDNGSEE